MNTYWMLLFFFLTVASGDCFSIDSALYQDIAQEYHATVDLLSKVHKQESSSDLYEHMTHLFLHLDTSSSALMKRLKKDLKRLKKDLRRLEKDIKRVEKDVQQLEKDNLELQKVEDWSKVESKSITHGLQDLVDHLENLLSFVKKNKSNNDAILFHHKLRQKYTELFEMVANEQDVTPVIAQKRAELGISDKVKRYLVKFVQFVDKDHQQIELFEDLIHADDIDLKLVNYVFKIELIKLRNAVMFHESYKQQKLM